MYFVRSHTKKKRLSSLKKVLKYNRIDHTNFEALFETLLFCF